MYRSDAFEKQAVNSIISQFGLSIFTQDVNRNTYTATSYNFWICPSSVAFVDDNFVCQASSLEFLIRYNFDFNKFLYKGISYLNKQQVTKLKQDLETGVMLSVQDRNLPLQDEDKIRQVCAEIAEWTSTR